MTAPRRDSVAHANQPNQLARWFPRMCHDRASEKISFTEDSSVTFPSDLFESVSAKADHPKRTGYFRGSPKLILDAGSKVISRSYKKG